MSFKVQFKVRNDETRRPGWLPEIAFFDEAGSPLSVGGGLAFGDEVNREDDMADGIEIVPLDATKATSVTAKFNVGSGIVALGSWNRNIIEQHSAMAAGVTYLTILLPAGESYYTSGGVTGLWETPVG